MNSKAKSSLSIYLGLIMITRFKAVKYSILLQHLVFYLRRKYNSFNSMLELAKTGLIQYHNTYKREY